MEAAAKKERSGRKRARDDDEEAAGDNAEILQPKKKEYPSSSSNNITASSYNNDDDDERGRYEFHDGVGVFDFPWLKEEAAVVFDSEPSTFKQNFTTPCDIIETHRFCDQTYSPQNLPAGGVDGDHDGGAGKDVDESLWTSLAVDDLENVDCIWSCIIDHPLHINGFNKDL